MFQLFYAHLLPAMCVCDIDRRQYLVWDETLIICPRLRDENPGRPCRAGWHHSQRAAPMDRFHRKDQLIIAAEGIGRYRQRRFASTSMTISGLHLSKSLDPDVQPVKFLPGGNRLGVNSK